MSKHDLKPPLRIKLSPIGRHPKHRKRDPYDPRTLRYCARALLKERDALKKLAAKNHLSAGYWLARADEIGAFGKRFAKEARAIERKARE